MTENKQTLRNTFCKEERLCYQKSIDRLFAEGQSFIVYPLRIVYFVEEENETTKQLPQIVISVSKRKFKRANKRNRVKRLVREAYRLNKSDFIEFLQAKGQKIDLAILYLKDELPTYAEVEKSIHKTLSTLKGKIGDEGK